MDAHEDGSITEHVRQRGVYMAVTELEENQINDMLYELDMCQDDEKKCANIILDVWNKIQEIMIRENKFSEELGSVELDWQVMNCANDDYSGV